MLEPVLVLSEHFCVQIFLTSEISSTPVIYRCPVEQIIPEVQQIKVIELDKRLEESTLASKADSQEEVGSTKD